MNNREPARTKGRGRPKATVMVPRDRRQDIWIHVELVRRQTAQRSGRMHSVSQACKIIAQRDGMWWLVGGDDKAIARAMKRHRRLPFSHWRQLELSGKRRKTIPIQDESERVITVCHRIQHAGTLRSRYVEANRLVRSIPAVRDAWTNMVHDMLGLPRPTSPGRPIPGLSRPPN